MRAKKLLIAIFLFASAAQAQDPEFSQYYAAPLYLNPAFAGTSVDHRFIANYRNQWPNISHAFGISNCPCLTVVTPDANTVVSAHPFPFFAISLIEKVPSSVYSCLGSTSREVYPSPKSQKYSVAFWLRLSV